MDNAASSIISALGAGSGVNFLKLAEDLSAATYATKLSNLESRSETLQAQISSATLLRSSLLDLASALGDRVRSGDLAPRATLSNASVVGVATTSGINPKGAYSLEVSQLAQGQTLVSRAYSAASDTVGEGTLRIRFGTITGPLFTEDTGQPALEIAVDAGDTLQTLAARIASESGGAMTAYVASGTGGAQLVIKGAQGATNAFILEGESSALIPTPTPGDLSYLSWTPATDLGELRQSSQDALFELDSVAMSSASNTVTGLPEGMTFTLKGTNPGAPTSNPFANDTSAITKVMEDFVAALNDVAEQVAEQAAALGGVLANDPGARELKRDLAALTSITVIPTAASGEPSTLADLGLTTNRDGSFTLDTARLAATLSASPDAAAAMFTAGPFGLFATVDGLARDNTLSSDPGSLGGSLARYERLVESNGERLEDIAEQQENLRTRLTRDLVAAERRVAASQSTLTFLQQQIDAWNGSSR